LSLRVGFYLAPDRPVEQVLPLVARAALRSGQRILVVAGDADLRARLDTALWEATPEDFLAHGSAGGAHDARQPILLAETCDPANGAKLIALADGCWRDEVAAFERAFLFFDDAGRAAARETWRKFDGRTDITREFHELVDGKWVQRL